MKEPQVPELSRYAHNPNVPLIGHGVTDKSSLFLTKKGVITYSRHITWSRLCVGRFFLEEDPVTLAGTARILTTPTVMRFRQMAKWVTGCAKNTIGAISRAIVEQELDITRTQWDALIEATEGGEDYLLTNSRTSFAFAKMAEILTDENGEYPKICVLYAYRSAVRNWYADVRRLGSADDWHAGDRLVLRNKPLVS